jgi:hypothetical protein
MRITRVGIAWRALVGVGVAVSGSVVMAATGDPTELKQIQTMAVWRMSHPDVGSADDACGIKNAGAYEAVRLDFEADEELKDAAATAKVKALDQKVLALLQQKHWAAIKMGKGGSGIPNLRRCYRKSGAIAQIYETTDRCTMNTPCTAYDGFTVVFYLPQNG